MTAAALFVSGVLGGVGIGLIGHLFLEAVRVGDDNLADLGGEDS